MSATGEAIGPGAPLRAPARAARPPGRRGARPLRDRGPPLGRPLDARVPLLAGARPARRAPAARLHLPQRRAAPPPSAAPVPGRGGAPRVVERLEVGAFSQAELAEQVAGILGGAAEPGLVARLHARCEGNAFFAEELLAASDAPPARCRRTCATSSTCAWRRCPTTRAASCAWPPRPAGARATGCSRPSPPARARAGRGAARGGGPARARPGRRRLRVPPRAAAGGRLRRPAPRRATALHLALAEACATTPASPTGRRRRAGAALERGAPDARGAGRLRARRPGGRAGLRLRRGRPALRARARDLGPRRGRRRAHAARPAGGRDPRGAQRPHRRRAPPRGHARAHGHRARRPRRRRHLLGLARERLGALPVDRGRQRRRAWPPTATPSACSRPTRPRPRSPACWRPRPRSSCSAPRGDETRAACERAIAIARAVGARASEGHALNSLGVTRFGSATSPAASARCARPRRIAEEVSDHDGIWRAYTNLSECLDEQGRARGGGRARARGRDAAPTASGMRTYAHFLQGEACWRLTRLGRLDETAAIVERVLAEGPKGVAAVVLHDNAAHLAMRRGSWTARPSTSSWRASCSAAPATRCGSATRPPGGPRPPSGRPIPSTRGRSPRARWTSSPRTSTPTTRRACTRPPCAPPPTARSARSPSATSRGAAEAQRDARAIFASLRALLAPERWHDGAPGPSPPPSTRWASRSSRGPTGRPDPAAWATAAERFAALEEPFELRLRPLAPGRGADRRRRGARGARRDALREAADLAAGLARAAARGRGRGPRPARPPGARGDAGGRGAEDPESTASGSPTASSPSSRWSPRATRTARSAGRSSSPRRPRASTSRASWPSSACARASRRRPRRTAWGWPRPQRQATAGAGRRPSCST